MEKSRELLKAGALPEKRENFLKAETLGVYGLTREEFLHNFVSTPKMREEANQRNINIKQSLENPFEDLQDMFKNYYAAEIRLRLGDEVTNEIKGPDFGTHDNTFSHMLRLVEDAVEKTPEGRIVDPLMKQEIDPVYFEIYKQLRKDLRTYFTLGFDEIKERLQKHAPEIWKEYDQFKKDRGNRKRKKAGETKTEKTKHIYNVVFNALLEKERQAKDDLEKKIVQEQWQKIFPESKEEKEKEQKRFNELRKSICGEYIESIKEKDAEVYDIYQQGLNDRKATFSVKPPNKGARSLRELFEERVGVKIDRLKNFDKG